MKTDIEIANEAEMRPIEEIAAGLGIRPDELELYGAYKAKLAEPLLNRVSGEPSGKLVLVTAISPTPAGEGKTTTTVGLSQALCKLGKKAVIALREPSLGPVFGMKGGAAGGGYAQVVPMEDINLHFTGDIHAVTAANNLLCALIDNHIQHGNTLGIDTRKITFKRVIDINDRALRSTIVGLGGSANGYSREDGFMITVASEVMAILCLARDIVELEKRLGKIVIGRDMDGGFITAAQIGANGAMAALLKDAVKPNLVQTLENTPCIIHGGPFANIAHGCNSIRATELGLKLADILVTEAGFGSDLGAEKFFDIKCRAGGLKPSAAVLVATARALKYNGGKPKNKLSETDTGAIAKGLDNLRAHIRNLSQFGVPVVVALNRFNSDSVEEIALIRAAAAEEDADFACSDVFAKGGEGGVELAEAVLRALAKKSEFRYLYDTSLPLCDKAETIARNVYGAERVEFSAVARKAIKEFESAGYGDLPVCMAKTQYSLTDDPKKLGRPAGFVISVKEARLSAGAGFVVMSTGDIMTMPGLPKKPAAESIGMDSDGRISGLF